MGTSAIASDEMKLSVHYSGLDADRGRMSALDLGPAILGIGEMVGETSRILYGDATRVRVDVRADFEHASFGVEFVALSPGGGMIPPITLGDLANIATILGFAGGVLWGGAKGVLALLKWQRRRKIDAIEKIGDEVRITIQHETQNITIQQYNVFISPVVRRGMRAFVAPLEGEGIDAVTIKAEDQEPVRVEKAEQASVADAPLPEKEVSTSTSTAILEIVNPSLNERYKWRFAFGGGTIWAEIVDAKFLADVAARAEQFGAGDALRAEIEIRTTQAPDGFRHEYRVLDVLEHIRGERGHDGQLPLL